MSQSQVLAEMLNLNNNRKMRAKHNLTGINFPFHTRNPERVKFEDDFNEIVGIIARYSCGYVPLIESMEKEYYQKVVGNLDIGPGVAEEEVHKLFTIDFNMLTNPHLFLYQPVLMETNGEKSESKGKELLGIYLTKLLKLDENEKWKNYILTTSNENNLYGEVISKSLPELPLSGKEKRNFHFFDQEELLEVFNKDLDALMANDQKFIDGIGLLISYYFFYYINQQTYMMDSTTREKLTTWYGYDKERISTGREAAQLGYKLVNEASKNLLVNNDLLDYLNVLTGSTSYQSLYEILNNKDNHFQLGRELMQFNYLLAKKLEFDYDSNANLVFQINQLKNMLNKLSSNEAKGRFRKTFDEISRLGFIKKRGRLGYVLNATQDLIVLLVTVIIGEQEKILLKDLLHEFEKRGLYFDKTTEKEIILLFEKMNILEKLSDSGDAQYVRSIL